MSDPVWPDIRYQPWASEWQMPKLVLEPMQTEMEGGNVRTRGRPGDDVAEIQQTLRWMPAEYATFLTFFRTTLSFGRAAFVMPVWMGESYETRRVRFIKPFPTPRKVGRKTAVAMSLRVYQIVTP